MLEDEINSPKNNAYIESFVVHAKILIEFLYGKPRNNMGTILSIDYGNDWRKNYTSQGKPLERSQFSEETKERAKNDGTFYGIA